VTACAFPGAGGETPASRPGTPIVANPCCPSALSLWLSARHHPFAHQRNAHCLASAPSGLPAGSYSGHSPRLRGLKHPADQGKAPGTGPAPAVLPALVIFFVPWVTSLEGVTPRDRRRCVQPSQAGAVCTVLRCRSIESRDFGGPNVEASPYPSASVVCGSAPSPHGTHWQALAGLSWLSCSPPDGCRPVAGMVVPVRPVARLEAPHASRVERGQRPRTPSDGIWRQPAAAPALKDDGPSARNGVGHVRVAPTRGENHRIECRDCSGRVDRLLPNKGSLTVPDWHCSDKPPSNRTSTSPCIRLYGPTTR